MDPRVELDEFVAYIRSEYPSAPIKTIKKTWIKLKRFFDGEHKAQYIVIEALADVEKMVDTFLAAANVEEEEEHKETPADSSNHVQSSASRNTRSTRIRSTRKCSDTSGSSNLKPESLAAMRTSVLFQPVSPSRISRYGGNHWGILNDIFNVPEATKYQPGEICYEASARRKNDQWTSPLVKQQCGRKADGIFKSATKAYELAIMKAAKIENGPQGTKANNGYSQTGQDDEGLLRPYSSQLENRCAPQAGHLWHEDLGRHDRFLQSSTPSRPILPADLRGQCRLPNCVADGRSKHIGDPDGDYPAVGLPAADQSHGAWSVT
ncbi:hypothetical protein BGZ58_005238 [Dissophora ornata]|nr:hypothetical protein BGZ58_005238 [Dissophora ornata]